MNLRIARAFPRDLNRKDRWPSDQDATPGFQEKKTTIPVLSNMLIEAKDDQPVLTVTDLEIGIRRHFAS